MGWIKNRIDAEYRKHHRLDWSRIAEAKIIGEFRVLVNSFFKHNGEMSKDEIHIELLEEISEINEENKMPIMYCSKCKKPAPNGFHEFEEVCECRDWYGEAKKKGWILKRPKKFKYPKEIEEAIKESTYEFAEGTKFGYKKGIKEERERVAELIDGYLLRKPIGREAREILEILKQKIGGEKC